MNKVQKAHTFVVTLLFAIVGALAFLPGSAAAQTPQRWSNPATWGGSVPAANTVVTIPAGKTVLYDVGTLTLQGIMIDHDATLIFEDKDFNLTTKYIVVHGTLQIGTEAQQFQSKGVMTFTGTDKGENIMPNMGTKGILVHGGVLDIHGKLSNTDWTRINEHANKGATTITLEKNVDWQPGNVIVIASTDYDLNQAERLTITSVNGNKVSFTPALQYDHFGQKQNFGGKTIENRAEVGLISRNILLQGDEPDMNNGFGGHVMTMPGSVMRVEGVELYKMGQSGILARYPLHWHLNDIALPNNYVRHNSIHHTFNRCITVHGTRGVTVESNVCYETEGHSYFIEDGNEENNVYRNNLGINARRAKRAIILSDDEHVFSPSVFWISNPNNSFYNNVAAGSEGTGFWFDLPHEIPHDAPSRFVLPKYNDLNPMRRPLGAFEGNITHSNKEMGVFFDKFEPPQLSYVNDLTVYKSRDVGIWNESNGFLYGGSYLRYNDVKLMDNRIGALFADMGLVTNSVIVGDSANKGNPKSGENTGPDGRSLPFPYEPQKEWHGIRFYTGASVIENTTFVNLKTNDARPAGAFGWNQDVVVGTVVANSAKNIELVNSQALYIHGDTARKAQHIKDIDGSLTGFPGGYMVTEYPLVHDVNSVFHPEWKGYAQQTPVVQLRSNCGNNCDNIILRDDGAVSTTTFKVAAYLGVANHTYYLYRQDNSCNFEVNMNYEKVEDWVMYGAHYTCGLSKVTGTNGNTFTQAASIEEVRQSNGTKYYYDQAKNKLYFKVQGTKDAEKVGDIIREPGNAVVRVAGTGTNQITTPQNDPNRPTTIVMTPKPTPSGTPSLCQGDINGDKITDISDYSILIANFLKSPVTNPAADINGDGAVDVMDYSLLVKNFLHTCQ